MITGFIGGPIVSIWLNSDPNCSCRLVSTGLLVAKSGKSNNAMDLMLGILLWYPKFVLQTDDVVRRDESILFPVASCVDGLKGRMSMDHLVHIVRWSSREPADIGMASLCIVKTPEWNANQSNWPNLFVGRVTCIFGTDAALS